MKSKKTKEIDETSCHDVNCPFHGTLSLRGRTFYGKVIRKFHKRVVIEFGRTSYIRKYERYMKLKTRIHARLPLCLDKEIGIGDQIKITECRPLSKLVHFVVTEKIKEKETKK